VTDTNQEPSDPIVIKKYANRRLYNTATSSYVTLDHLSQMVKNGSEFVVYDAKSGEDITRSVLTQIIFEEEAKGQNLLPINFLRQLIKFYGDSLQVVVPDYLDMSMQSFTNNQDKMRDALPQNFSQSGFFKQFEDMGRQNLAIFDQAMQMFALPGFAKKGDAVDEREESTESGDAMDELKQQMAEMQQKIDAMSKK
jgi:polyhydroxyalkanoate synthesis repressor PhaR